MGKTYYEQDNYNGRMVTRAEINQEKIENELKSFNLNGITSTLDFLMQEIVDPRLKPYTDKIVTTIKDYSAKKRNDNTSMYGLMHDTESTADGKEKLDESILNALKTYKDLDYSIKNNKLGYKLAKANYVMGDTLFNKVNQQGKTGLQFLYENGFILQNEYQILQELGANSNIPLHHAGALVLGYIDMLQLILNVTTQMISKNNSAQIQSRLAEIAKESIRLANTVNDKVSLEQELKRMWDSSAILPDGFDISKEGIAEVKQNIQNAFDVWRTDGGTSPAPSYATYQATPTGGMTGTTTIVDTQNIGNTQTIITNPELFSVASTTPTNAFTQTSTVAGVGTTNDAEFFERKNREARATGATRVYYTKIEKPFTSCHDEWTTDGRKLQIAHSQELGSNGRIYYDLPKIPTTCIPPTGNTITQGVGNGKPSLSQFDFTRVPREVHEMTVELNDGSYMQWNSCTRVWEHIGGAGTTTVKNLGTVSSTTYQAQQSAINSYTPTTHGNTLTPSTSTVVQPPTTGTIHVIEQIYYDLATKRYINAAGEVFIDQEGIRAYCAQKKGIPYNSQPTTTVTRTNIGGWDPNITSSGFINNNLKEVEKGISVSSSGSIILNNIGF